MAHTTSTPITTWTLNNAKLDSTIARGTYGTARPSATYSSGFSMTVYFTGDAFGLAEKLHDNANGDDYWVSYDQIVMYGIGICPCNRSATFPTPSAEGDYSRTLTWDAYASPSNGRGYNTERRDIGSCSLTLSGTAKKNVTYDTTYYFDVSFNTGKGTGGPSGGTYSTKNSTTYNYSIPSSKPTWGNHEFLGWTLDGGITLYKPGSSVSLNTRVDHTFYAVFDACNVWVKLSSGWKQGDALYIKTSSGWKQADTAKVKISDTTWKE